MAELKYFRIYLGITGARWVCPFVTRCNVDWLTPSLLPQTLGAPGCRATQRVSCPWGAVRQTPSPQDNRALSVISVGLCHHPIQGRQSQCSCFVWQQEGEFCGCFLEQSHSWETNCRSAGQEIPCLIWNLKVHCRIYSSTPLVPDDAVHTIPSTAFHLVLLQIWTVTLILRWRHIIARLSCLNVPRSEIAVRKSYRFSNATCKSAYLSVKWVLTGWIIGDRFPEMTVFSSLHTDGLGNSRRFLLNLCREFIPRD
jgi:hypothetical protein